MVELVFDAARANNPTIRLTFGRSRSEFRWHDLREMLFSDFAVLLSRVNIGAKDGSCYTPAVFSGFSRNMNQAKQIDIAVLDADCGHTMEEIRGQIEARGWRAVIHSTHSHLSDTTLISAGGLERWKANNPGGTVSDYMAVKEGYLPRVIENADIREEVTIEDKRHFVISHAPCPKFRIVIPIDAPWIAADFETQQIANARWRERIHALASALRLRHDQSCVDTSRLFYLPRRKSADSEFLYASIDGALCPLWTLPDAEQEAPSSDIGGLFSAAPGAAPARLTEVKQAHKIAKNSAGEWIDLTDWAARYATRFEVVTALRARSKGVFSSRGISGAKHHIVCPNADSHFTNTNDGTGAYAINASQIRFAMPSLTGFQINCMHNGCSGFDRLDHLAGLLRCDALSIADLTDEAFLIPERPAVDALAIIQSRRAVRAVATPGGAAPATGDDDDESDDWQPEETDGLIPEDVYSDLPGVLALLQEWIMAGAFVPQPALTLGASMAFCATVIGQRVRLAKFDTRPNIYVLAVAHSGAGKEWPRSAIKRIAAESGLFLDLIGSEQLASDAGVIARVAEQPRGMLLLDEIHALISAAKATGAESHLKNIIPILLQLYSSSDTIFQGKTYADSKRQRIIVDQPCVSLYGSCLPSSFADTLSSHDVKSGLLSRMVVFDAGDNDPLSVTPTRTPIPQEILDWVEAWNRISPIADAVRRVGGQPVVDPRPVAITKDAEELADDFNRKIHEKKQRARRHGRDALYVRVHQNALKFALIRACADVVPVRTDKGPEIDLGKAFVDARAMRWGISLAWATVKRMDAITDDIADSKYERDMIALRKFIKGGGEMGRSMREMARHPAGRHPKKTLDDYLETIARGGYAKWVESIATKTRKRNAWVHRDYLHKHIEQGEK